MRDYLDPGEEVRLHARPHGVALVRPLLTAVLGALAGATCVLLGAPVSAWLAVFGAAVVALAAALAFATVWQWDRTSVVLTSRKLFVVYGIVGRRMAGVNLEGVPVEIEQSIAGRALGYGTLVAGDLEIPHVPHPRDVYRLLAAGR